MGNFLVTQNIGGVETIESGMLDNKTMIGKRFNEILKPNLENIKNILNSKKSNLEKKIELNKDPNFDLVERACCLGLDKNENFLTVKVPSVDENYNYLTNQKIGYEIIKYGDEKDEANFKNICSQLNLDPQENKPQCDALMVNKCAKNLYDSGCIECSNHIDKEKCVPIWSASKKCYEKNNKGVSGNLSYGNEECSCINSFSGFSLNNNPSNTIIGEGFKTKSDNPYGVTGSNGNDFTKYSLNIFDTDPQYQRPQVLDTRCASSKTGGSRGSGKSKQYLLDSYADETSICLSQINIGNSEIGVANFNNVMINNNCGGGGVSDYLINDKVEQEVNEESKVDKEEQESNKDELKEQVQEEQQVQEEKDQEQQVQEEKEVDEKQDYLTEVDFKIENKLPLFFIFITVLILIFIFISLKKKI
tara:strand:+ start:208 stop:1461 length:1254 start_codon:yes stop_codon:yes gene_type:complete